MSYHRTVWYELLCGEWPFKGQPPEAIIWQVGKGMKQTLANLQASRDVKVTNNDTSYTKVKVGPRVWAKILQDFHDFLIFISVKYIYRIS